MRRRILPCLVLGCCCGLVAAAGREEPAPAPADPTAADLQAMQGTWSRELRTPQGAVLRVEKVVAGQRDTVTEFDPNGNVIHAHRSDFTLKHSGGARVFTFSNSNVTAGPNTGKAIPGPTSFIYRIEGDLMFEAWGLLDGDRSQPLVLAWKRVKKP